MKKRLLSAILSMTMCVSVLPMTAFADATEYDLWVNGERFTSEKLTIQCGDGTAKFDPDKDELTLKDVTITESYYDYNIELEGAIYAKQDIDIVTEGTNVINLDDSKWSYGIYVYGDLTLSGEGSLDVTVANMYRDGIWAEEGDLTVAMAGKLTVNAGDDGLYADYDLKVTGSGDIDIKAGDDGLCSWDSNIILSGSGDIVIDAYNGIYSDEGNVTISNNANVDIDAKEDCIYAHDDVTLSGSGNYNLDVDLESTAADDGIYSRNGNITIATTGTVDIVAKYAIYASSGAVDISASGNVILDGVEDGIWANSDITISGSGDVNVTCDNWTFVTCGNLILSGTGKVIGTSEEEYCVVLYNDDGNAGTVLLNGKNPEVSFTTASASDEHYAVSECEKDNVNYDYTYHAGTVAGNNLAKYDVEGAPDESSVKYTLRTYNATFDMGGHGTAPEDQKVAWDETIEIPSDPTADGFKFEGWYSDRACTKEFDFEVAYNVDMTVFAKWTCLHANTEVKDAKASTLTEKGYTGDTYCKDCGEKLETGKAIPTLTPEPTPSNNPTPTPAPELNVGDFVDRCYEVALGREADEEGYEYWVSNLNNGQACGAQVGFGFIFSAEYINKNTTNEQFVTDMYSMFFGREADEAGYNYWLEQLNNGTATREQVFAGFANSEEFYNLCNKYGVVSGYYAVGVPNEQQGGVNCFVARLYKVCLNRLPDMGGQAGWVMKLMSGEVTGSTCAYGFVFSPEFITMNLDNVNFVNYMYKAFFGREADQDGLNYWVEQLNAGTATREDIFAGFSGSAEFANLCASYGINV